MKIVYLNNIRGFQKAFIPIADVNFFVGENSAGKTTVLSLLKLMSTSRFWINDEFNNEEIELGFFNELISSNAYSAEQFQLGYTLDAKEEDKTFSDTLLATYYNVDGAPKLKELKLLVNNYSILVQFGKNYFKYKIKPHNSSRKHMSINFFKEWIEDTDFSNVEVKTYKAEDEFISDRPYFELRRVLRKLWPSKVGFGHSRPHFISPILWMAPIRTKTKRIYENFKLNFSPEGDHTPLLIKNILADKHRTTITRQNFIKSIKRFGKESGLFDKIDIKYLGKDTTSPFILNVFLNNTPLKITNVGYGVGQILPFITEILSSSKNNWFSLQQPEVHLHPKAQAAFGEFIYDAAINKSQKFLIETHSDFIIDRYRRMLSKGKKNCTSQILFFERKEGNNTVSAISIEKNGQYEEKQSKEFREFFIKEQLEIIQI